MSSAFPAVSGASAEPGNSAPSNRVVLLLGLLVGCCAAALVHRSLFDAQAQSFDALLYARSLWGVAHGEPVNSVAGVHAMAIHGHWVLYLLAPLAWVLPAASVLVLAAGTSLAVTGALVGRAFVRAELRTRGSARSQLAAGAFGVLAGTVAAPLVGNPFLFDTRPDLIAVPLATAALLRLHERRSFDAGVASLLLSTLLVREEFALLVAGTSLLAPIPWRRRCSPGPDGAGRDAREGVAVRLILAAISIGYYLLYWFVLRGFLGGEAATERVASTPSVLLGSGAAEWLSDWLDAWRWKLEIALAALGTLGGCALLGWRWLGVAVPGMGFLLVGNRMPEEMLRFHYSIFAAPALLVAGVDGWTRFRSHRRPRAAPLACVAIAVAAFFASSSFPGGGRYNDAWFSLSGESFAMELSRDVRQWMGEIGPDASVAMPYLFAAPWADRAEIWDMQRVVDVIRSGGRVSDSVRHVILQRVTRSANGHTLVAREGYRLVAASRGVVRLDASPDLVPWGELPDVVRAGECTEAVALWPSVGIGLCNPEIALDGSFQALLTRATEATEPLHGLELALERGGESTLVSAAGGLIDPASLPVGWGLRVRSESPLPGAESIILGDAMGRLHRAQWRDDSGEPRSGPRFPLPR